MSYALVSGSLPNLWVMLSPVYGERLAGKLLNITHTSLVVVSRMRRKERGLSC